MIKVGITGGIGAGKTTVSRMVEALGYPVYPADYEAKRLMTESPAIKEGLLALLGPNVFEGKTLNRPFIAQSIFGNNTLLKKVNTLVHPVVKDDFKRWCAAFSTSPFLFLESALMYEAGLQNELDTIICVTAPLDLRVKRVMERDQVSKETVLARIAAQKEEEEQARSAQFVICNDDKTALIPQLHAVLNALAVK